MAVSGRGIGGRQRIADAQLQAAIGVVGHHLDHAAFRQSGDAVDDRILEQGLQGQARHADLHRQIGGQLPVHAQARAQPQLLDGQILAGDLQFFGQGGFGILIAKRGAEQIGQILDGRLRGLRIAPYQGGDGVHRIEQEMRIDARLQGLQRRLGIGTDLLAPLVAHIEIAQHDRTQDSHHQGDAEHEAQHADRLQQTRAEGVVEDVHQPRGRGGECRRQQTGQHEGRNRSETLQPCARPAQHHRRGQRQPLPEGRGDGESAGAAELGTRR